MPSQKVIATIINVKYTQATSHFCVFNARIEDESSATTFVGYSDAPIVGLKYDIEGDYEHDRRYGLRFSFTSISLHTQNQADSLIAYFSSSAFKGIGPVAAKTIVDTLGTDCIAQITNDPTILETIDISEKQVASILTTLFSKDTGFNQNIEFLTGLGLNFDQAHLIYQTYKSNTQAILSEDPFQPYYQINEIDYRTCEVMAKSLDFDESSDVVMVSRIVQRLEYMCANSGSTYIPMDVLANYFMNKIHLDETEVFRLLSLAIDQHLIVEEDQRLYLAKEYESECIIASYLNHFPFQGFEPVYRIEIEQALGHCCADLQMSYDDRQLEAIQSIFDHDITIINGGPGTGKSTITKAIVYCAKHVYLGSSIVAAAPTGRAAKRLSDILGVHSTTLHSLLKWDKESNSFRMNEENPVSCDILIIDECSMVDNQLFAALCCAGHNIKKLIFIGDSFQLPSVGVGNLLQDLIDSNIANVVTLNQNYRQSEDNAIVTIADHIRNHCFTMDDFKGNARFIDIADSSINDAITQIYQHMIDQHLDIDSSVVLAAMHERVAGIKSLNIQLQPLFNPDPTGLSLTYGYNTFHIGDKVLQIKNDVEQNVFNGDIGVIVDISASSNQKVNGLEIIANFDNQLVLYTPLTYKRLRHAYAMSVHKAQGNEFETVILVSAKAHSRMFNEHLLYTAITRAKKNLIVVGSSEYFIKGVNRKVENRETTLVKRIRYDL